MDNRPKYCYYSAKVLLCIAETLHIDVPFEAVEALILNPDPIIEKNKFSTRGVARSHTSYKLVR